MKPWVILTITLLLFLSCNKTRSDCDSIQNQQIGFTILEHVYDTILKTDTAFTDNNIFFKVNENYDSIQWQIGNDSRTFNDKIFNLVFNNEENIKVSLSAVIRNNCFSKQLTANRSFVVIKNDGSQVSPLIGNYRGINTDNTLDTFTIAIKFWKDSRYPWWSIGAYSIHNFPKNFKDSTQNFNGYVRSEIDGIVCYNGYKNLAFDKSGNIPASGIKGYCSLKTGTKDSLIINYKMIDTNKLTETGNIYYLNKKFVGVKF